MEVVVEIMGKLLKENVMIAKCKGPKEAPKKTEFKIAEKWNIQQNFNCFDDSKVIKRK